MRFNVILFDNFETMDVFGPVEVIGMIEKFAYCKFVGYNFYKILLQ